MKSCNEREECGYQKLEIVARRVGGGCVALLTKIRGDP